MGDILKHIGGAFSAMGPFLTFIAIVLIVVFFFFKDAIITLIKNIKLFKKPKQRKVIDAQFHDIFTVIDQVRGRINNIMYVTHGQPDESKTVLIRKLINNQLDATTNNLTELLKVDGIDSMENQQLKYELIKALKKTNEEYNDKSHLGFLELGVSADDSKYLLDEYAKFRDEVFDGFIDRAESITTNSVYDSNFHRISSAFEVIAMGLYLIARDSKYTCSLINGKYLKYKETIKL